MVWEVCDEEEEAKVACFFVNSVCVDSIIIKLWILQHTNFTRLRRYTKLKAMLEYHIKAFETIPQAILK